MFWFIVLLLIAGAGFYFYQKLTTIEREIRAEQEAEKEGVAASPAVNTVKSEPERRQEEVSDPPIVSSEVERMAVKATPVSGEPLSLEDEVLSAVNNLPGVMQAELYNSFPDVDKKRLQQVFKELADSGKLRREKQGSSYVLHPA